MDNLKELNLISVIHELFSGFSAFRGTKRIRELGGVQSEASAGRRGRIAGRISGVSITQSLVSSGANTQ